MRRVVDSAIMSKKKDMCVGLLSVWTQSVEKE